MAYQQSSPEQQARLGRELLALRLDTVNNGADWGHAVHTYYAPKPTVPLATQHVAEAAVQPVVATVPLAAGASELADNNVIDMEAHRIQKAAAEAVAPAPVVTTQPEIIAQQPSGYDDLSQAERVAMLTQQIYGLHDEAAA